MSRESGWIHAAVISKNSQPVDYRGPPHSFAQEPPPRCDHRQRKDACTAASAHPQGEVVVLHDRDLAETAGFAQRVATNELRLVAPWRAHQLAAQVDQRRRNAKLPRWLLKRDTKPAKDHAG